MSLDSAYNLTNLGTNLNLAAKQFFGLLYCFAGDNLAYLELQLGKIIISDFRLCL